MPGGRTHAIGTALTAVAVYPLSAAIGATTLQATMIAAGAVATLWIHPDLDQAESRSGAWYKLWYFYGLFVKHRSWISHAPIISTAIRVAYTLVFVGTLFWLLSPRFNLTIPDLPYIYFFAGMCAADYIHILLDFSTSALKKIFGGDSADLFVQMPRARRSRSRTKNGR